MRHLTSYPASRILSSYGFFGDLGQIWSLRMTIFDCTVWSGMCRTSLQSCWLTLVIFFPRSGAFIDFARGSNTNSFARRLQTMVLKLKLARQVDPSACCQHTSDFSLLSVTSNKFRNSGYWIGISSSIFVDGLVSLSFILHAIVRFWIGSLLCQLFCPLFLGGFFCCCWVRLELT